MVVLRLNLLHSCCAGGNVAAVRVSRAGQVKISLSHKLRRDKQEDKYHPGM
jgi:hypothetical protein